NAVAKAMLEDLFARVQREALMRQAMLYIGPLPSELQQNGGRELFRRLSRFSAPIALGVDAMQPPRLVSDHPLWEMKLPLPGEQARTKIWEKELPAPLRGADLKVDSIARAFKLTPGEIGACANEA